MKEVDIANYKADRKNPRFEDFEVIVCQLQLVNLKDIDKNRHTLFNQHLQFDSKVYLHKVVSKESKKGFLKDINYNVRGCIFSLEYNLSWNIKGKIKPSPEPYKDSPRTRSKSIFLPARRRCPNSCCTK